MARRHAHFPNERGHDRLRQDRLGATAAGYGTQAQGSGRMPGFGACSPTSRSKPSSSTCGACDDAARPARDRLGARAPRHPHRHHRRRHAVRQRATWSSAPTSAPASASSSRSPGSPAGWSLMGVDLVDLRHRPQGPGRRRGTPVAGRTVLQDTERAARGRRARRRRSTSRTTRRSPSRPTLVDEQFVAEGWKQLAESRRRSSGRPASSAGDVPRGGRRLRRRRVRGRQRVRQRRRALPEARRRRSTSSRSSTSRTTRRRGRPARAAARPSPAVRRRRRRSTRPASTSTCTWSATSARGASRRRSSRSASLIVFFVAVLAAAPPRPAASPQNRSRPLALPATGAEPHGPVPAGRRACWCWPSLFGALSFVASRLLAPRRPSAAKEAPYECGIVPSREPPERFPVSFYVVAMLFIMFDIEIIFIYPYAVDRECARQLRVLGDARVLGDLLPRLRLRRRPRRPRLGPAAAQRPPASTPAWCRPSARSRTTIRRVGTRRPRRRGSGVGGMSVASSRHPRRRPRRASSTTSSPARLEDLVNWARGRSSRGRPRSGWRAARSR